jgi:hypothetical protein
MLRVEDAEGATFERRLCIAVTSNETVHTSVCSLTVSPSASGAVYNLNGQRVTNPAKGLYIVNGKKTVMK